MRLSLFLAWGYGVKMDQKWWNPLRKLGCFICLAIVLVAGTILLRSRKEGKNLLPWLLIGARIRVKTGLHERYVTQPFR